MTATPLLECTQLTQIYRVGASEVIALQGLDLAVAPGEMVGVIGSSGSGKSTLLRALSGLLQPSGGSVRFDDVELGSASPAELDTYRRDDVGFVWQSNAENLLPEQTAEMNVKLILDLLGVDEAGDRAVELLERVGLGDRRTHLPTELSGGEQQRVALAMALANSPRLLLADEPTGALDAESSAAMFELMREIQQEDGLTQVIVSHDGELARYVDRVIRIRDGRVSSENRWDDAAGQETGEALVIDTIGRLQLTDEQRAALGGSDRVTAEVRDGEVTIRPVDGGERS